MSVSVIEVTSLHSIPVVPLDGSVTLSVLSGDTVYYGQDQTVSASNNAGSLTVGGGSVTLTVQGWIASAGVSAVQMVSGSPTQDVVLGSDGTLGGAGGTALSTTAVQAIGVTAGQLPAGVANVASPAQGDVSAQYTGAAWIKNGGAPITPEAFLAAGDGATDDTTALKAWLTSGKHLALTPGKTYLHQQQLTATVAGQVIDGKGASLKRAPQAVSACDVTQGTITAGSSTTVKVQAISGGSGATAWAFKVSDQVVIEQGGFFDPAAKTIQSITGSGPYTITVSAAFGSTGSFTNNATTQATLAGGVGATLRHGWNQFSVNQSSTGASIRDVVFDGNSANWTWGRWQHTAAVVGSGDNQGGGARTIVHHCQIINQYGDGCTPASANFDFAFNSVENIKGRGLLFAGTVGNPTGVPARCVFNRFINCNGDTNVAGTDGTGSIDFSAGGPSCLIHGNYVNGGVDGIGGLFNINTGHTTISDNEFWNLTGSGINAIGGSGSSAAARHVIVHDNRFYACSIKLSQVPGQTVVSTSWDIHDNQLRGGVIQVLSANNCNVHDNILRAGALAPPDIVDLTAVANGGTVSAGTKYIQITATNATGESTGSTEVSVVVGANGAINVTWSPTAGSTGYKIYMATSPGGESGATQLAATITSATTTAYTITSDTLAAGGVPASDSTWNHTQRLIELGAQSGYVVNSRVSGNICDGGGYGVYVNSTAGGSPAGVIQNLVVERNTLTNNYTIGVNTNGIQTGIEISRNTIIASNANTTYNGIISTSGEVIRHNYVDFSAAGGGLGIKVAGTSTIAEGNTIKRGSTGTTLSIAAGASTCIVRDNVMDSNLTDSGTSTLKQGNSYSLTAALSGAATLVAGTVTVSTTQIRTADNVLLTVKTAGGTQGDLSVGTITNGTSFVINSTSNTETSVVYWEIRH